MRQCCSIGVRTQAETIKRNKNKRKKREISPRKASRKGDAFFLSFYFVHLAFSNADPSTLPHTGEQQREEKHKIKKCRKKMCRIVGGKKFPSASSSACRFGFYAESHRTQAQKGQGEHFYIFFLRFVMPFFTIFFLFSVS